MPQLWHAANDLVRLQTPRLTAVVDRSRPAAGMHDIAIDGESLGDLQLLGVDLTLDAAASGDVARDFFVRGGDLAVAYMDQPQPAARTQVYWRVANPPKTVVSVQLLVSVQTNRLDGCPKLGVRSRLTSDSVLRLDDTAFGAFVPAAPRRESERTTSACGFLFRLPGDRFSFAQFVHPADARTTNLTMQSASGSQGCELDHELFAEHLEKGVILRARVLGLLLERANDQEAAAEHFASFLAADLPLTT